MLVNGLKTEAESSPDSGQQKKLLAAAKLLADATAKMVEAAKVCSWWLYAIFYIILIPVWRLTAIKKSLFSRIRPRNHRYFPTTYTLRLISF